MDVISIYSFHSRSEGITVIPLTNLELQDIGDDIEINISRAPKKLKPIIHEIIDSGQIDFAVWMDQVSLIEFGFSISKQLFFGEEDPLYGIGFEHQGLHERIWLFKTDNEFPWQIWSRNKKISYKTLKEAIDSINDFILGSWMFSVQYKLSISSF